MVGGERKPAVVALLFAAALLLVMRAEELAAILTHLLNEHEYEKSAVEGCIPDRSFSSAGESRSHHHRRHGESLHRMELDIEYNRE